MFIISFFTASLIGRILGIALTLFLLLVAFVFVVGLLAVAGGPDDCTPGGGPITVDAANSASFQQKWDGLNASLDGGSPGSATFNESEISSRAQTYLDENDVDFADVLVCVHDGDGEASATFSFLGMDVKVKVRGTVDLDGSHPQANVDDMEIGSVPGWLTGPTEGIVNSAIDSALDDLDLDHTYTPALTPGQATVNGVP